MTPLDWDRWRSCSRKKLLYITEEAAAEDREEIVAEGHIDPGEPYPCRHCPWWHLGRDRRDRRANRQYEENLESVRPQPMAM